MCFLLHPTHKFKRSKLVFFKTLKPKTKPIILIQNVRKKNYEIINTKLDYCLNHKNDQYESYLMQIHVEQVSGKLHTWIHQFHSMDSKE